MQFKVHHDPVWRDRANFIINIELGEPGYCEQLWARRIDGPIFEICCIPFFAYNLALGDIVETKPALGGEYMVKRVREASGRYVFRIWFAGTAESLVQEVVAELRSMGALVEYHSENLVAIDARAANEAEEIARYLHVLESSNSLEYETGKL